MSSRSSSPAPQPASSIPQLSPEETQALLISLKRRNDVLEKEIQEMKGNKKKQKYRSESVLFLSAKDNSSLDSNGTNTRAQGIFKLASMHPLSEILAENDRREVARLEGDEDDSEEYLTLTPEQLEERKNLKRG